MNSRPSDPFRWTAQREQAALLIAASERSDAEIAADVGVHPSTLWRWRQHPDFAAKVGGHIGQLQAAMLRHAIAKKRRRVAVLDQLHTKALAVIEERAAHAALDPGAPREAATGLLTRQVKVLGYGTVQRLVTEWAVDVALLREIRGIHAQAAKELGQWPDRSGEGLTTTVEIVGVPDDAI